MEKYRVRKIDYGLAIKKIKVIRETEKSVFVEDPYRKGCERKELKSSSLYEYCDSFGEAKTKALDYISMRINQIESKIQSMKDIKHKINNLKESDL